MSISLIFLKPLSAVMSGRSKLFAVAAIMASGVFIECCCFKDMVISFMVLLKSIISQSFNKLRMISISCGAISGFPNNSISDITETASEHYVMPDTARCPSMIYIRTFVSTKKSIPFIADNFLKLQPVDPPFQLTEMFSDILFLPLFHFSEQAGNILSGNFFYFNNHVLIFLTKLHKF